MRTLLVDNHDSFTYNLFHYLAEITGREPVVVANDDSGWRPRMLAEFDAVVLSPGPGHPAVAADFGICREILEHGAIPVLGVCLGHQGAALQYGAHVGRAHEPRHGRLSPVTHTGTGLFAGLPSPFDVVRYHSLAVTGLPAELEPVARTPDGTLMAFAHRTRPLWGVQFHPESILTQHGHALLANFIRLAGEWHAAHPPGSPSAAAAPRATIRGEAPAAAPATTPPAGPVPSVPVPSVPVPALPVPAPRAARVRKLRVLAERVSSAWSEEAVFARLFHAGEPADAGDHAFWLDGSGSGPAARFSVMGDASGPLARVARADVIAGTVTVRSAGGTDRFDGGFFDWLERDLAAVHAEVPPLECPFTLGWVGYLGYELKAECGGTATHRAEDPDAVLVFADRALVFDHETGTTTLLALADDDAPGSTAEAQTWLAGTAALLATPEPAPGADPRPEPLAGLRLRHGRAAYLDLIAACHEDIAAGETYEVCLTNMAEASGALDPWQGYRALRRLSPAPYGALLRFGDLSVLSTSPERFLRISADGTAESRPIKGTRPRGATPEEDAAMVADLLTDEKDRAENLMIVDLVRNDLGRHAAIGSVDASDIFRVETYATVHQLVSTVRAQLRPDRSAVAAVRAAFPAGSMTGAPKIRTMQILDALEQGPRGIYSGSVGYFSLSGAVDLSVAIRTAVVTPGRLRYGVGGAIVALSDPIAEYEETAVKAAPLLSLTRDPFPERHAH
ncbi:aminodeoxychorismate synthase component I [Streptomyces bambusae]|uniref:aminodeoxychorismate synthase component I n=1 Tax=Streptomyces bambusae TaxID=1550616 RepID=UPI001CFCE128|nr:aminodeoxychorismate synthase component I [Streptomyces bambusae]MCB5166028.1 aminodeoxychorismate synthase component I [Streptomyces bambusae]